MNDERSDDFAQLDRQLAELPREMPPAGGTWEAIRRSLAEAPLDARVNALTQSVEPAHDLWPQIAGRISEEQYASRAHRRGRRPALAVLAACLAVAAIGGFFLRGHLAPVERAAGTPEPDLRARSGAESAPSSETEVGSDLLFPPGPSGIVADALTVYETHIALVREQRETIEASLAEYPSDLSLRALWRHAYETELRLIDEAGRTLATI
jgi:hypothetical protein